MTEPSEALPLRSRWLTRQRASVPFVTFVVALGLFVDILNYSIVLSVFPFRLEYLGYGDVSGLSGWLLFIYSGALVLATPPIAALSERLRSRRSIMIGGLFSLLLSQLLLMEASSFGVMCAGRLFEGISSSIVLTAGLALICDTTPEKDIGSQMGIVMAGVPLGSLIGPPVGGALYARWGYRAPFVFGMIFTAVDLVGRVLVVEGGSHPDVQQTEAKDAVDQSANMSGKSQSETPTPTQNSPPSTGTEPPKPPSLSIAGSDHPVRGINRPPMKAGEASILQVFWRLVTSPRALVAFLVVFFCSSAFLAADVAMPLHTQAVWGLNSTKVGLVFIAAIVPTLISSPLAGYSADKFGPEWVATSFLLAGIPWWGALTKQPSLVFFVACFAVENFFIGAAIAPITTELAAVARSMDGIGYAHMYGVFNMVFGLGNTVGSVIGGQIYDHSPIGWSIVCYVNIATIIPCVAGIVWYMGEKPILPRLLHGWKAARVEARPEPENTTGAVSEEKIANSPA